MLSKRKNAKTCLLTSTQVRGSFIFIVMFIINIYRFDTLALTKKDKLDFLKTFGSAGSNPVPQANRYLK